MSIFAAPVACGDWILENIDDAPCHLIAASESGQTRYLDTGSAGIWKSVDGGNSWQPITMNIYGSYDIYGLLFTVYDALADTITLKTSIPTAVFHTVNGGLSWTTINPGFDSPPTEMLAISRSDYNEWLCQGRREIARSHDAGDTWTIRVEAWGTNRHKLIQDPNRDSTWFSAESYNYDLAMDSAWGGLRRSDDMGNTWQSILDLYELFGVEFASVRDVDRLSNGDLLVCVSVNWPSFWPNGTILRSSDDGETWIRELDQLPDRFNPREIIEDVEIPGTVLVGSGSGQGLYRSTDHGLTWSYCENGMPENWSTCENLYQHESGGSIYACILGWGLFSSVDHGMTWQQEAAPPIGSISNELVMHNNNLFSRNHAYRQWQRTGLNGEWEEIVFSQSPDTFMFTEPMLIATDSVMITVIRKRRIGEPSSSSVLQIAESSDGGSTWDVRSSPGFYTSSRFSGFCGDSLTRIVGYNNEDRVVYVSRDNGSNWQTHAMPPGLAASAIKQLEHVVYLLGRITSGYEIYRSEDDGASWIRLNYSGLPFSTGRYAYIRGDELYVFGSESLSDSSSVWQWNGDAWSRRGSISERPVLGFAALENGDSALMCCVTQNRHTWVSRDLAQTWTMVDCQVPFPSTNSSIGQLVADQIGRRIWASSGAGTCYITEQSLLDLLSVDAQLTGTHGSGIDVKVSPNPFNESANIRYTLPRAGHVSVLLYDTTGRLVMNVASEIQQPGIHAFDISGRSLPSGKYFVQFRFGEIRTIVPIVHIR